MISRSAQLRARGGCAGAGGRGATATGAAGSSAAAITSLAVSAASQQPITNKTLFAVQLNTEPMRGSLALALDGIGDAAPSRERDGIGR